MVIIRPEAINVMRPWWQRLLPYTRPHATGVISSLTLTLIIVGCEALRPWPIKIIVDHVLPGQPLPPILAWLEGTPSTVLTVTALAVVFLFLTAQSLRLLQSQLNARIGSRMVYELGSDLFHRLQRLSLRFHGQAPTGDLVRRVLTDTGCVRDYVVSGLLPVISASVNVVVLLAIMWRINWQLGMLATVRVAPLGWLIRAGAVPMRDRSYLQSQAYGAVMTAGERALSALPIVQAFQQENREVSEFRRLGKQTVDAAVRTIDAELVFKISVGGITAVAAGVVMVWGGWQVLEGQLTLGELLVFLAYLSALYTPLDILAYATIGFAGAAAGARRVFEMMDHEEAVEDRSRTRRWPTQKETIQGRVALTNVTFGYEPNRPVLHDMTLTVEPGEVIALVGSTGAGKSTLISLIPRFYDPWRGTVQVDDIDVRELPLAKLRAQVSLVLQDPFLLPMSIRDNIAYGRPEATAEEIYRAAQTAQAAEFIEQLPEGYNTVIGERGATLSGGQQQRLAIARAILRDSPIMVFDEPTSALDASTEAQLLAALKALLKNRTAFVIAHRFSTVHLADRVVVINQGRIVEAGRHTELVKAGGLYQQLHDAQAQDRSAG